MYWLTAHDTRTGRTSTYVYSDPRVRLSLMRFFRNGGTRYNVEIWEMVKSYA
jgi:hypothetical protein